MTLVGKFVRSWTKKSMPDLLLVDRQRTDSVILASAFVDGEWITGRSGKMFDVVNPSTGKIIAKVPDLETDEILEAIAVAHRAFADWRLVPAPARASYLSRMAVLMRKHSEQLSTVLTLEQGKPIAEARGEIAYAASFLDWFAEEAIRLEGQILPAERRGQRMMILSEPVGVVAAITPWNFPSAMVTRKIAPALAAGCTVILKPAEATPLSALAIAEIVQLAGLPPGVFNVVTGAPETIGRAITDDARVRKLTFTGSTEVGRHLFRQCASTVKKISLELGGNAPFIVFEDADIDRAVDGAIVSKFRNGGQTCVCANRFYVHDAVHDAFVEKFAARISAMQVGDGFDPAVDIGPLVNSAACRKVAAHIDDAVDRGAKVVIGGALHPVGGNYFSPTLLTEVPANALVTREETFGPLAGIVRFSEEAQVIEWANDSEFGLAAYAYTNDLGRAWRISELLEVGMVGINTGLISSARAPFGGVKQSGLGREGSSSGILEFIEQKYVCIG